MTGGGATYIRGAGLRQAVALVTRVLSGQLRVERVYRRSGLDTLSLRVITVNCYALQQRGASAIETPTPQPRRAFVQAGSEL